MGVGQGLDLIGAFLKDFGKKCFSLLAIADPATMRKVVYLAKITPDFSTKRVKITPDFRNLVENALVRDIRSGSSLFRSTLPPKPAASSRNGSSVSSGK